MADERSRDKRSESGVTLPPWLRNMPLPVQPAATTPSLAPQIDNTSSSAEATSTLPDWLRDLQGTFAADNAVSSGDDTVEESTEAQPDWLARLDDSTEYTSAEAASPEPEHVPDWLQSFASPPEELQDQASVEPTPVSSQSDSEAIPAWLHDAAEAPPDIPAPPLEPPAGRSSSRPPMRMPIGATDWLRSLGQEPDPAAKPAQEAQPSENAAAEEENLPSWLTDISHEEIERDLAELPVDHAEPAPYNTFTDAPSWLAPGDEERADTPPRTAPDWLLHADLPPISQNEDDTNTTWMLDRSEQDRPASQPSSGDLPDWLRAAVDDHSAEGASGTLADHDGATVVPDWLRGAAEESPVLPVHDNQEPLPDWLRSGDEPADTQSVPARDTEVTNGDALPDWLRNPEPGPASMGPIDHDDALPAWLRDDASELDADRVAVPAPDAAPAFSENASTPNWLHDAPAETTADNDVPDWLRGVETELPITQPSASADIPAETAADNDVPDWLRGVETESPAMQAGASVDVPASSTTASEQPQTSPTESSQADLPPWLQHDDATGSFSPTPADAGLPAWLHGAETDAPANALPTAFAPAYSSSESSDTLPQWLRDDTSTLDADTSDVQPHQTASDFFGGTDLPTWLRGSESGANTVDAPQVPSPPERQSSDWLAQLRAQDEDSDVALSETIPLVPVAPRPSFSRTPAQLEAVALLQRLVAEPFPTPAEAPVAAAPSFWRRMGGERLLYILLLVAMLVGLIVPSVSAPLGGIVSAPDAQAIANQIGTLSANDVVLVAYEWDARRRSELSPLEQAVMQHLAQQKVKFVFVSTNPQGTLLSFDARDQLVQQFGYRPGGLDYILLGYKPGGELALRGLAQNLPGMLASDFQGADARKSVVASDITTGAPRLNSLNDFAMVLVMADAPQDVQAWMEQVHSAAPGKPFVFLLPAETTPVVAPYLQQPGVLALSGRNGALVYDQARTGATSATSTASSQLPFAITAFVVLLVLGTLMSVIAVAATRRKRPS